MTTNNQTHDEGKHGRLAIYQRPAAQVEQAPQYQQRIDLEVWAKEQGYTDITVFAERYIPGDIRLMLRDAFIALKKAIAEPPEALDPTTQEEYEAEQLAHKPITAILVASVDRLFHSPSMLEDIALFLNLCSSHGIVVITPTATYDFRNHTDVVQFCFACQTAGESIQAVITSRLQSGRRAAARRKATPTN